MTKKIITRFPPSPTGYFHVGSARTALFNYLFAKANNGIMKMRIEDTDKERSEDLYTQNILSSLKWLGIKYDGDIVIQSKNKDRHEEVLKQLIKDGYAYEAEENKDGNGKVIRFKNPNKKVTFNDLIRGDITFDTSDLKDFIIAKNINEPIYHLAVVVDDIDMEVTHILRGEDHISNTPRQILIYEALDKEIPQYGHIPLILGPDKSKLSKRHGAVSIEEYKKEFLPEAFVNYLALLGWNPGDDREIFSTDELEKEFDINKVQKSGAIFSEEKLKWINAQHLRNKTTEEKTEILKNIAPYNDLLDKSDNSVNTELVCEIIFERAETTLEISNELERGEFDYIFIDPDINADMVLWKNNPDKNETALILEKSLAILDKIEIDNFDRNNVKENLWPLAEEIGKGEVLWPIRVALSGKEKSPDPFVLSELLGKTKTIKRIENAIQKLKKS